MERHKLSGPHAKDGERWRIQADGTRNGVPERKPYIPGHRAAAERAREVAEQVEAIRAEAQRRRDARRAS